MNSTTLTAAHRGVLPRAVGLAVAVVAAAALLLGLMAGALGERASDTAADTTAPAPSVSTPVAPAAPGELSAPVTPVEPPSVTDEPAGASTRHVVAVGETLAGIARATGVPVELLAADNGVSDPDRITAGDVLAVPPAPSDVVVVATGTTLSGYADRYGTTVTDLAAMNPQITDVDHVEAGAGLRVRR